ncbi:haloacid dehalogenase-like hydrolase family protein, partial [Vibrio parahaemolyticus V-223/04]
KWRRLPRWNCRAMSSSAQALFLTNI